MIDLDVIKERYKTTSNGVYHVVGVHYVIGEADFNALVAEVEHLRGERAAVVAWLRDYAVPRKIDPDVLALLPPGATVVSHFADEIERGEHRREEPTP